MKATMPSLEKHAEHFRERFLADLLQEATAAYWTRRAETFAAVGTPAADEVAQACRNSARLALIGGEDQTPDHIVCGTCGTPTSPWSCSCGSTRLPELSGVGR